MSLALNPLFIDSSAMDEAKRTSWTIWGLLAAPLLALAAGVAWYATHQNAPEQVEAPGELPQVPLPSATPDAAAPAPQPAGAISTSAALGEGAEEHFTIKRVLPISGPIKYGEWHWDETGVPPGEILITVDLDARVISVFRGGYEIGASAVLLGTQEKPTPTGVFPILAKMKDHVSSIYDADMPYTQRLTNYGISIHATKVEKGYASHGCVGVPLEFAKKVFGVTKIGDHVIITRGKTVAVGDSLVGN